MQALFSPTSGRIGLRGLLAWTVGSCLVVFALLQLWRPCYFLTDDNLSGTFPMLTEMGRALRAGHTPFKSDYLFGGNYNLLRDLDCMQWHPFTLLPALLADTAARFWIIDISALLFLLTATVGFTLLAHTLREELSLKIPDVYLVFYTLSFVFSTFILTVGPSWVTFLSNQSALPWLALGVLSRKVIRGTLLVALFTVHEILAGYPPVTVSAALCLTLFAIGIALWRRSFQPLFCWFAGNLIAPLLLAPLLLSIMDGFGHSVRIMGLPIKELSLFSIPAPVFSFSFLMGNWAEPVALLHGDNTFKTLDFPYLSSILACAAAWCIIPALFGRSSWRSLDKVCLVISGGLIILIIRPDWLAVALYHLPFFRSMRWPFREGILFLFFIHLFLVLRFPERPARGMPALAVFSLVMFLAPLPFIRVPTLNAFFLDRQLLFSGQAERFWTGVKTQLKPTDEIVAVINWPYWKAHSKDIPHTLLGTANYPEYFQVRCASGYSPTAPKDQLPLKTRPWFWFGAFSDDQLRQVLAEKPGLRVLRILGTQPIQISLSNGAGAEIDLTPYLRAAGITGPAQPSGH